MRIKKIWLLGILLTLLTFLLFLIISINQELLYTNEAQAKILGYVFPVILTTIISWLYFKNSKENKQFKGLIAGIIFFFFYILGEIILNIVLNLQAIKGSGNVLDILSLYFNYNVIFIFILIVLTSI